MLVEIKTHEKPWGSLPPRVNTQVQAGNLLTGAVMTTVASYQVSEEEREEIAALQLEGKPYQIENARVKLHPVKPDAKLQSDLRAFAKTWYEAHVLGGLPLAPEATKAAYTDSIKALELAAQLRSLEEVYKAHETAMEATKQNRDALRQQIAGMYPNLKVLAGDGFTISRAFINGRTDVNHEAALDNLLGAHPELRHEAEALLAILTTRGKSYDRWTLKV